MNCGLYNSKRVISLLSENYMTSDHCKSEWSYAYNMDPQGTKRKLLPFLIHEVNLNPLARAIIYKNLINAHGDRRKEIIIEEITGL